MIERKSMCDCTSSWVQFDQRVAAYMHLTCNPSLPPVVHRLPLVNSQQPPLFPCPCTTRQSDAVRVQAYHPASSNSLLSLCVAGRAPRVSHLGARCSCSPRRLGVVWIQSRPVIGNSLARRHPSALRFEVVEEPLESADTSGFTDDAAV